MGSGIPRAGLIEGYAIVSEDGMIADASGIMPWRSNSRPTRGFSSTDWIETMS